MAARKNSAATPAAVSSIAAAIWPVPGRRGLLDNLDSEQWRTSAVLEKTHD